MTETVREMRRADELKPGDWVAAGPYNGRIDGTDDAEVLFVYPYASGGGQTVSITIQEVTIRRPAVIDLHADAEIPLLTGEEIAGHSRDVERIQRISEIRQFADWLEDNPWVPLPASVHAQTHGLTGDDVPLIRQLAERLGVKVDEHLDDRTDFDVHFGDVSYCAIAWHREGRPAAREAGSVTDEGLVDETPGESATIVDANLRAMGSVGLVDETPAEMTPPPCADHSQSELGCLVCTVQRNAFYTALGRRIEEQSAS